MTGIIGGTLFPLKGEFFLELIVLGTGNAQASSCYNTCFALLRNGECFLVDAGGGNGIFSQLKKANIALEQIHDIFLTHKHIDHLLGVLWLVRIIAQRMDKGAYHGTLTVYGNTEVMDLLFRLCEMLLQKKQTAHIGKDIHFVTVNDGEEKTMLGCRVTFFDIGSKKASQFGFSMLLPNGMRLTCCGDEPYNPCEERYVKHSAWLLHEAFCLYSEADQFHPYEKHHSTVREACALAETMGVKNLLLYHTEDSHLPDRKTLYLAEGKQYYSGNLLVPDDLERFVLC